MLTMKASKKAIYDEYHRLLTTSLPPETERLLQIGQLASQWVKMNQAVQVSEDRWRADAVFKQLEDLVG